MNKLAQALVLVALAITSFMPLHTAHASGLDISHTCKTGQVHKGNKCVNIEITGNEYLSRLAHCLANHGQTTKSFNSCMRTHKGNNQVR